jgi:2-isopropylmalate synthase
MLAAVRERVRGVERAVLSVHCHDDLGLATANSLAGLQAGARQVECTMNGTGERAGNAALEEIVMALQTRGDCYGLHTAVNTRELHRTSQLLAHVTGVQPQPNKAIVGRNAFAHEAGIHQDGVLKERTTYEIMTPESVGVVETRLVLGKHSGRHALARRYQALGYELDGEELERAHRLFKLLADAKKEILDEDLIAIVHHGTMDDLPQRFRLRGLHVVCGDGRAAAHVRLEVDGRESEAAAEGDGPIAAALAAVAALVDDFRIELEELNIQSVTPGVDALGEASLKVRLNGQSFRGTGASPDVVNAAVRAQLNALNKAAQARDLEAAALERASYLWGV